MRDIRAKKPRVLAGRSASLRLTADERFLVSRIDGRLSVDDLVGLTGLAPDRVEEIVSKLELHGAIDFGDPDATRDVSAFAAQGGDGDGGTASLAEFAAALGMDPSSLSPSPSPAKSRPGASTATTRSYPILRRYTPSAFPVATPSAPPDPEAEIATESSETSTSELDTEETGPPQDMLQDAVDTTPAEAEEHASKEVAERNYRKVYEVRWHPLPVGERGAAAKTVHGPDLLALCFDADPKVIAAIFENPTAGLDHARIIASYHRTGTGLETLARRQDWLKDLLVERRLLRNPMIGAIVLGRVMGPKHLLPTYKIAIDRDVPELTRTKCRGIIRQKWQTATSEERADLLVRTEARCLAIMSGCTFDAKTTAILCGRPINSAMFVQSIAKFAASPPGLLSHLMKQPFVRKNAAFKKMLLAHPNMPGDVKRSL